MSSPFNHFIGQLPQEDFFGVKVYMSDNIVLFRPKTFVINVETFFEDYHFALLTSTPPPIKIGKKEYHVENSKLLIFNPGDTVTCTQYVPTQEYRAISIKKSFFEKIFEEATGKRNIMFSHISSNYTKELLNIVLNFQCEVEHFKEACPLMIQSISIQMIVQLLRDICSYPFTNYKNSLIYNDYIKKAIEYMEAYYNANITIEDICHNIHVSPYHFIRMFKANTGKTPHKYLLNIRLLKAKEMIEKGNCSVGEVARLNGFINPAHFSSVFKQAIGMPPSKYKKKYYPLSS